MKLLVLSNGHGEDMIAVRIIEQLRIDREALKIFALPIVGQGIAYTQKHIPLIGEVKQMPSGGFIYMDSQQLWRDVRGGLVQLTLKQLRVIRQFAQDGGFILAVGDVVPLLFAWLSGTNYAFVGTARSEYYLRNQDGWLQSTSWLERKFGSVYHPFDRWLMSRPRCQAVFPRDKLTTDVLREYGIKANNLGNPMADTVFHYDITIPEKDSLSILLLPGSRIPEAEHNWRLIIQAIKGVMASFSHRPLLFLAAIAPGLKFEAFTKHLIEDDWHYLSSVNRYIQDDRAMSFRQQNATLVLSQNAYAECLTLANIAIAMAGTATEQFVGLGKPVITIPGNGPQFTYAFAEAQTRLLGCSIVLVEKPEQIGNTMTAILNDSAKMQRIAVNGKQRMGDAGAALRIAQNLQKILFKTN